LAESFLQALAKQMPVPGGGAAAAYSGAVGLALLEKIVRVELQRQPTDSELQSFWDELLKQVCSLAETLIQLRDEDGRIYMRFAETKAAGLSERDIVATLEQAIESPLKIMETGHESLDRVSKVGKRCKKHLISDLLVVCELLRAAFHGAYRIAQANLLVMPDSSRKGDYQGKLNQLRDRCREAFRQAERSLLERAGAGS
jgi:formiminotetrahydrofolate cyclodeaminase